MIGKLIHISANVHALLELAGLLRRYRALTVEMARRDLSEQYAGQVFGFIWALVHPIFMILLYVFLFAFVFKVKMGGTYELPLDYTAYLLAGLIPWLPFLQVLTRSPTALTSQVSLVKQVVFPIEILPAKNVLAGLVPFSVGLTLLVAYVTATHGAPPVTYLLLPVLVAFQLLAMGGIAFAFAAVGAYLRDLKDFVQMTSLAILYVMPVFYMPEMVPAPMRPLLFLNPFSYPAWCYQDALYFGRFEHPWAWPVFMIGSVLIFAWGYRLFRRLKPHFGDVL
jgi:lipopolysaccharide transport system permease protein